MNIGNKIKELRKQRGLTQEQLANSIGISFQSVSKWENDLALPDISMAPILASFFGVSLDELFEFHLEEIEQKALAIARSTVKYRGENQEEGIRILEEGLKQYPENDILLGNLLYLIDYNAEPDRTIKIAARVIDATRDNSTKYDALRFMAYAYRAKGDMESARGALEQIPEIYFTRLSEMAYVLSGEEKRQAAEKQKGVSLEILAEMQTRIAECHEEKGDWESALREYKRAADLLELFEASSLWDEERRFFQKKTEETQKKLLKTK